MIQLGMGDGGALPADDALAGVPPRIARLIAKVETAWAAFHESHAGLPDDEMLVPGVCGEWSVRDLIAHVTWWDAEALSHLPTVLDGGTPPRYSDLYGGIDAFNAMKTEETRALSLDDVRQEAAATHQRLLEYLRGVPAERLTGNSRFTHRLRLDTYGHYPTHTADIRRWRAQRDAG